MPITRLGIQPGAVGPERIATNLRKHKFWEEPFAGSPLAWDGEAALASGAPSVSVLHRNAIWTGFHTFEFTPLATAADSDSVITSPVLGSEGGYDWGGDQFLADGYEINFGGRLANHPRVMLTGSGGDASMVYRVLLSVEDISGINLFFGVRGGAAIQAVQAAIESYTDLFGIQILGDDSSAAGAVNLLHCLTGDASDVVTSVATASTAADATLYELKIVILGLQLRAYLNGVELLGSPLATAARSGIYLTPILRFVHTTDLGGQVKTFRAQGGAVEDIPEGVLTAA